MLVVSLLAGCASLVHPGPAHVAWAQQQRPDADLGYLETGREIYVRECGGCHGLKLPRSQEPGKWAGVVEEMTQEEDVVLTADEQARVVLFLEAAATVTDEEIEAAAAAADPQVETATR